MKTILILLVLGLAGCATNNEHNRSDFNDQVFDPFQTKVRDRAAYLRAMDSGLSINDAYQQAYMEFEKEKARYDEKQQAKAEQQRFEEDFGKTLRK